MNDTRKVLLVDDDDYVRLSLKRMKIWDEAGYNIVGEAQDGHQALEILSRKYVDLVLTDIRMPKINGIELLEKVVAQRLAACVVFLSEHSEFSYAKQGLVLGAFDYLVKPVSEQDLRDLLARVDKHLRTSAPPRRSRGSASGFGAITRAELALQKEYLLAGDMRLPAVAGVLADKVLQSHGGDLGQAAVGLNGLLTALIQSLWDEMPWLDSFVDIKNAMVLAAVREDCPQTIRQRYIASLEALSQTIMPFVPLMQYGSLIIKAQQYVMQHIDEDITLTMLADTLFVNRTYLSEVFKKKTGLTLVAYISGMKMQRAKNILANTDLTITEIAELLSYKDVEYFSRLFKQRIGCSPSDYRAIIRQNSGSEPK